MCSDAMLVQQSIKMILYVLREYRTLTEVIEV